MTKEQIKKAQLVVKNGERELKATIDKMKSIKKSGKDFTRADVKLFNEMKDLVKDMKSRLKKLNTKLNKLAKA